MFKGKKKIELNDDELRIIRYALNDFRNSLIKENKYTDAIDDVMVKLKNKMKVDRYDLGAIINGLDAKRKALNNDNQETTEVDYLLLRLLKIYETL